ncbi:TPA: thioredoxin family protein [Candidatus Woesearchaeota archaeon]|nr:thioredoxin family protein [Candidatus Woesearchaeota archaeon]
MESEDFKMQLGSMAIDFDLRGVDGRNYMMRYYLNKEILVVVFTCNHCPYAQAYEQRLIDMAREFSAKAAFFAINSNDSSKYPQDSLENMKTRAMEKGYPYPYLCDESQNIARAYGALVTPHVFVFDKSGKLAYQGGIDNNWENKAAATEHYLRSALSELAAGREVTRKTAPVIGCSIKWK